MIGHDEARLLASAVADGEAPRTPDLDTHLASCDECAAFLTSVERLSVLTAALPREAAPASLPDRVRRRIRLRRRLFWSAPALAAATAAAVALTVLPGPGGPGTSILPLVPLPDAAAAEPLLRLRSLYLERTVTVGEIVTHEKIWWRAPGFVRVENEDGVTIETPAFRYAEGVLTERIAPTIALPEPLSPTVALIGTETGPGPVVAGLPTRVFHVTINGQTRIANVARGINLRGTETVVLTKTGGDGTVKTTQVVKIDPDLPDSLFEPPRATREDGRFAERDLDDLTVEPRRMPEGFSVVRAGTGPDGDAALLVRGSLPLLVRSGGLESTSFGEMGTVPYRGNSYLVHVDLYAPPSVQLTVGGRTLTVSAPLPLHSLVEFAVEMYGAE